MIKTVKIQVEWKHVTPKRARYGNDPDDSCSFIIEVLGGNLDFQDCICIIHLDTADRQYPKQPAKDQKDTWLSGIS